MARSPARHIVHRLDSTLGQHPHNFAADSSIAERRTRIVILITAAMMAVELAAGVAFGSMALLADGWHMSTHVAAFLISAIAYAASRRLAADPRFSFGTGKIGILGGYTSAVLLAVIALLMAVESVRRFFEPITIQFNQAIGVAMAGLLVNLICARLLRGQPHHHTPGHDHHPDLNLRSAYLHVLADALTSVAAIVALIGGKFFGWNWLDPLMGIAGGVVVAIWAYGLLRDTSEVLLDRTPTSSDLPEEIRRAVEQDGDALVTDLHVWQVGAGQYGAIVSLVAHQPKSAVAYRKLLQEHEELVHLTVEVHASDPGKML